MANNYTIKTTPKAADDLDNIYRYISEELFATSAATNILEKIENETKDIFKELSEIKELSRVNIYIYYPRRHTSRQRELFGIVMSRETMDKINWDTLSIDDIENVADEYFEDLKFLEP